MSYCRWSSECDVYVFEDVTGGWTTMVASVVSGAVLERIGGPYDEQEFNDPTPGACADRLEMIAAAGYNVPAWVITELRDEEAERVAS